MEIQTYIDDLSSSLPAPGGGSAIGLVGAIASSLCSMVSSLAVGKKRYEENQADLKVLIEKCKKCSDKFLVLMEKDEEYFIPLSKMYKYPKDAPDYKKKMDEALLMAIKAPIEVIDTCYEVSELALEAYEKGSIFARSDAGIAASLCKSVIESSYLNVIVNLKELSDVNLANEIKQSVKNKMEMGIKTSQKVYENTLEYVMGK